MMWEEKRFDEIGTIERGRSRHRPRNDESLYGGIYPFIQTGEVKAANFYISEFTQTYNEKGLTQSRLWRPGTLCITIAANIAETAILGINACFPDSIIGFIADETKCDVRFVKYFFDIWKKQIQMVSQGATQDNLSLEKLLKFKVPCPPLPIQQKIASILSAYDDLIENNLKRMRLLEEAAQHLYREWFVRFRFPGWEAVEMVGGLPVGWEKIPFEEALIFKTGKLDSNAAVENGIYPFFTCSQDVFKTNSFSFDTEAVILGGNNASGIYPLKYFKGKFDAYQRTYIIKPKINGLSYKYIFLVLYNRLDHLKNISTGSTTKFLTLKILNHLEILIPDKEVINNFEAIIDPIFSQMRVLSDQNQKLKEARDLLLPRLMNRTIEVEGNVID